MLSSRLIVALATTFFDTPRGFNGTRKVAFPFLRAGQVVAGVDRGPEALRLHYPSPGPRSIRGNDSGDCLWCRLEERVIDLECFQDFPHHVVFQIS